MAELPSVQKLEISDFGVIEAGAKSLESLIDTENQSYHERLSGVWTQRLQELKQANVKSGFFGIGRRYVLGKEAIKAMEDAERGALPDYIKQLCLALGGYSNKYQFISSTIELPRRVLKAIDSLLTETHRFTVFTSLTPLGYDFSEKRWEGTVPGLSETEILGGIIYKNKEIKPIEIKGSIKDRGLTENPTFIPANLPKETCEELAKQVSLAYNNLTGKLGQLVSVFKPFTNPEEVNPHIANDVAVINYSLQHLIEKAGEAESTTFAATLMTGLASLRQELTPQVEKIENVWERRANWFSTNCYDLANFLDQKGFHLKRHPNSYVKLAQKAVPRQEYLALQAPRQ